MSERRAPRLKCALQGVASRSSIDLHLFNSAGAARPRSTGRNGREEQHDRRQDRWVACEEDARSRLARRTGWHVASARPLRRSFAPLPSPQWVRRERACWCTPLATVLTCRWSARCGLTPTGRPHRHPASVHHPSACIIHRRPTGGPCEQRAGGRRPPGGRGGCTRRGESRAGRGHSVPVLLSPLLGPPRLACPKAQILATPGAFVCHADGRA